MGNYQHLNETEFAQIDCLLRIGFSYAQIAKQLNRHPSTISRHCRSVSAKGFYTPAKAKEHRISQQQASSNNARRYRLIDPFFETLTRHLNQQFSPAQALKQTRSELNALGPSQRQPSCATMYRLIAPTQWYDRERYPNMRLSHYYSKAQRSKRAQRAPNSWVAQCPTVDKRPDYLINRTLSMCIEIDTMVGRKSDSARLVVAVCRHTRYTMIGLLEHCTAAAVEKWVRSRMYRQKLKFVCLIPDQGSEFARLPNIKSLTVYPCEPHRPWQKPTVENTNGLIRHYVPKGSLISDLTHQQVAYIERQLNIRPKKCLDWKTPSQLLYELHPAAVRFE